MKKLVIPVLFILSAFLFQSCAEMLAIMKQNTKIAAATGASGIGGPESGESWKDPVGIQVGIETKFVEINENSSLNSGINFTYQGAGYEEEEWSGRVRLSYLNVPFMYNYQSDGGFYGEIGLQPGLLISAKDKGEVTEGGSYNEDYSDFVKGFELGLPVGFGYQVNEQVSVGARGIWGLTNNDNYPGSENKDHNYLILGVVRFNIGSLFDE